MTAAPGRVRPAGPDEGPARRRQEDGRRTTSGCSGAKARHGDRADLRLRRRARGHRALRAPAGLQPDVPRVRSPGRVVRGGVRAAARDRRRQGADGEPADARVRAAGRPARRTPRRRRPRSPAGTSARPQIYTEMVAAGSLPPRPGHPARDHRGARTPAGSSPSPRPRPRRRSTRSSTSRSARSVPPGSTCSSPATASSTRSPRPTSTSSRSSSSGCRRRTSSSSRTRATASWPPPVPASGAW